MKKFIVNRIMLLSFLLTPISLIGMNNLSETSQSKKSEDIIIRWDADDYAVNNWVQRKVALNMLEESGINLRYKIVIDVGCGNGSTTAKLAENARSVYGVDPSMEMLEKAIKTYGALDNISFDCIRAEELSKLKEDQFDCLTSFFCLARIKDKQTVFKNFYDVLRPGGDLLCNVATWQAKDPVTIGVEKFFDIHPALLQGSTVQDITQIYSIETSELEDILSGCGFKDVKITYKVMKVKFDSKDDYINAQRPVFMATPFAQAKSMTPERLQELFVEFVDLVWDSFKDAGDGAKYYPLTTTVVTAQKPNNVMDDYFKDMAWD